MGIYVRLEVNMVFMRRQRLGYSLKDVYLLSRCRWWPDNFRQRGRMSKDPEVGRSLMCFEELQDQSAGV